MYIVRSTKAYRKAYKRILRHKDFVQHDLDVVIDALAVGEKLSTGYRDHQLSGDLRRAGISE